MKKAISIWSFSGKKIRECIEIAKDAGYDGIELSLDETGEVSLESTKEGLSELRRFAEDREIKIHSVATGLYWSYSLTSEDTSVREKAYGIAEKQIETAEMLGADAVLIVPGAVGVDFVPGSEVVRYDVAYERSLSAFKKLRSKAERYGVKIGIENVWNKFLLSPLEMRDFIDEIGGSQAGSYFDVGNVLYSGYPEHWIRILGKRIVKVHFKDYRRDAGGLYGFVDLLSGDVNWPEVMKAFADTGYDGWVTAEMLPPYTYHSEQIVYNTSAAMNKIMGGV